MLEAYQAYGDYHTTTEPFGGARPELRPGGHRGDRTGRPALRAGAATRPTSPPFRRLALLDAVSEAAGERVTLDRPTSARWPRDSTSSIEDGAGPGAVVLEIYEKRVEKTSIQPTFVMDYPREVSPLARPHRADPQLTEHFDLVVGGVELVTAFSSSPTRSSNERSSSCRLSSSRSGRSRIRWTRTSSGRWNMACRPPAGSASASIDCS